jgi:hypothetical protein
LAAEDGLSLAMVMKVVGSKARLLADAAPMEPEPYNPLVPRGQVGYELVRRVCSVATPIPPSRRSEPSI